MKMKLGITSMNCKNPVGIGTVLGVLLLIVNLPAALGQGTPPQPQTANRSTSGPSGGSGWVNKWDIGTSIQGGRMKLPQDQTGGVPAPTTLTVIPQTQLFCMVEPATDSDHWTGRNPDNGNTPDIVEYNWTCTGGIIIKDETEPWKANWTAPPDAKECTISCVVSDKAEVPHGATGKRDDADVVSKLKVVVSNGRISVRAMPDDVLFVAPDDAGLSEKSLEATVLANGVAVPGVQVAFSATGKNAVTEPATSMTDANGIAHSTLKVRATSAGSCTVKAQVVGEENTAAADIYIIGGEITGDNVAISFCKYAKDIPKQPVLQAADNPSDVQYSWSVENQGDGDLSFVEKQGDGSWIVVTDPNKPIVTCAGTAGSTPGTQRVYDVLVKVTYSLHGKSCTSPPHSITVLEPSTIHLIDEQPPRSLYYYPEDTNGNGFDGQTRTYEILDQYSQRMSGVPMNEAWTESNPKGLAPHHSNWPRMDIYVDTFSWYPWHPDNIRLEHALIVTAHQSLWAGAYATGKGCGPLLDFPNVQYYTDGATGFVDVHKVK
jgi:hypothetical protein